jgi:hypothetical protein
MLAGLIAAVAAQVLVGWGASGEVALLAFGGAVALFVAGLAWADREGGPGEDGQTGTLTWRGPLVKAEGRLAPPRPRVRGLGIRRRPAMIAVALAGLTFLFSGGNQFTPLNLTTWVGSIVAGLAATWQVPQGWRGPDLRAVTGLRSDGLRLQLSWTGVLLAVILAFGVAMLFYRIAEVPAEMTSDHAEKLQDVQEVLEGQHRIFFPRNTGREAVQFYLIAAMTPLAGLSYLTMKLGTALVASFTLPFTFLLARLYFGSRLALLATAVLAMTRWHWQVARVGLRFPFPPAFGAAIMYFLLKAIRDRRRNDFLLCGLVMGLAQHTYTSLRLAPLAVLACIGIALVVDVWRREPPGRVHRLLLDTGLLLGIATLVFMPLARYAFDVPESFLYRGVTRLASDALDTVPSNPLGVLLTNVKNALLMFNWRGDLVWVNTIPGERMLDPLSGGLFVLGCAYGLYRLLRYRELPFLYLFVLLFCALLPSILVLAYPEENPSAVRSGMAIRVVVILVVLPLLVTGRAVVSCIRGRVGYLGATLGLAALLVGIGRINVEQYFSVYARQHTAASQHSTLAARVVNGFINLGGRREDVYILPAAHWFDWRLVAIQAGDIRWQPLLPSVQGARQADGVPRQRLYILHPSDATSLMQLQRWYPGAIVQTHSLEGDGSPWLVTVLVPPNTRAAGG